MRHDTSFKLVFALSSLLDTRRLGMPSKCLEQRYQTELGRNVARLRQQATLTQEQLAEKVGIAARYLQDIEAGKQCPSLQVLVGIRAAVKCSWEALLKNIGEKV
jgi:DNA-binding XRE family transcriptional regulator